MTKSITMRTEGQKERVTQRGLTLWLTGAEETMRLGRSFGNVAARGSVLLMRGGLGAGKTTFVRGFAEGLDCREDVQSPTFTYVLEYLSGRLPLYHLDLYRLADEAVGELDWLDEYLFGEGVAVVEWSEYLGGYAPEDALFIHFMASEERDRRLVTISAAGHTACEVFAAWVSEWSS
ncbi:tRNA (adenosine(37)-N6)-threonylcarbamoyltransferase complex ATPase subunit type 1 TsaE [Ferroacidibacillus organovorans]|uniref:tRNA threonylcarbamoyladenosine biosynthesis protein TsaE n=1 Tax=Ferroacidibacillus organovorans TaxID=1765683 RepID=A0A853KEW3_9BACL|nr:tRNA (adenosine(37)-N6)-threonylcarbamoyltransferase complex ATPase subunit type 1 TsaE [Ferroacidibacillus organovorans]KYP81221.1 hypothetical protein AYJ22_08285 [Ferroacidibacillus organovorans]OAG93920.1 hypothetical protein AYW79_08255 [Ferroacidibacillus organovorans]